MSEKTKKQGLEEVSGGFYGRSDDGGATHTDMAIGDLLHTGGVEIWSELGEIAKAKVVTNSPLLKDQKRKTNK